MEVQSQVQAFSPKVTGVFALLTAKPGVNREQVMGVMPAEIRATVELHLQGQIQSWYSRQDGRGVILLLNVASVDEASALIDALPLATLNLMDHEYIPVGPLMPLRILTK